LSSKGTTPTNGRAEAPGSRPGPGDIFKAIGFDVPDDESYNMLAEYAERIGARSALYRADVTLHGRCWQVGGGLEVWSVLYESPSELYYADCRPAFRGRYVYNIQAWEMAEYCEDGEAMMHARLSPGSDVIFELQNFTELKTTLFRKHHLDVALAGLASTAQVFGRSRARNSQELNQKFCPLSAESESKDDSYENEYIVSGTILASREILNSATEERLIWAHVDAGRIRLEVLVNGRAVEGKPRVGSVLSATVWLQGHVLQNSDILARYEGIDMDSTRSDFWTMLRRTN
jgi:hypothetical protein